MEVLLWRCCYGGVAMEVLLWRCCYEGVAMEVLPVRIMQQTTGRWGNPISEKGYYGLHPQPQLAHACTYVLHIGGRMEGREQERPKAALACISKYSHDL